MRGAHERDRGLQDAGLSAQDEILAIDGVRTTPRALADLLAARKPGETVRILISRRGTVSVVEAVLGKKAERSFRITPLPNPNAAQSALLNAWLPAK